MNKRQFLTALGALGLSGVSFGASAFQTISQLNEKKFVFILLRGAMDGLSLFPAYGLDEYYSLRPTIAVPEKNILKISDKFGFHPSFKDSFFKFYQNDELVIIPQAGQANNSRSHFQCQDEMEYGNGQIKSHDGFLNRMSQAVLDENTMSFTSGLPEIFKGDKVVNNVNLNNFYSNIMPEQEQSIAQMYKENAKVLDSYEKILVSNSFLDNIVAQMPDFKSRSLGEKIGIVMRKAHINISFIELLDWDTHARQGAMNGKLHRLFDDLNDNLIGIKKGLDSQWSNTTVVIVSEFGRSIAENGAKGTEHGHGNTMLITGGNVKNSKIVGDISSLKLQDSHDMRDLHVSYDYREVLAQIFLKHFKLQKADVSYILPNINFSFDEI